MDDDHGLATILTDEQQLFITDTLKYVSTFAKIILPTFIFFKISAFVSISQLSSLRTHQKTARRYWIGLIQSDFGPRWISLYHAVPNVYWKTGVHVSHGSCAYVDIGLNSIYNWGLADCEERYPFLCSNVATSLLTQGLINNSYIDRSHDSCPLGFLNVNGRCYKVSFFPIAVACR